MNMKKYYIYVYLDIMKPGNYIYNDLKFNFEPFYVGKGYGNRAYAHLAIKGKNFLKNKIIKHILDSNLCPIIHKLYTGLTNEQALQLEIDTIKKIGRIQNFNGPLTNMTDGGEGHCGFIQNEETKKKRKISRDNSTFWTTVKSKEFKNKMSDISKKRCENKEYVLKISQSKLGNKNPMFGKKTSKKQVESVKKAHKDGKIKLSEDGRKKIIESNKKKKGKKITKIRTDIKKYLLTSPDKTEYLVFGAKDLQKICGKMKIQYHVLKNNIGKIISLEHIKSSTITAKNTLNWQIKIV